MGCVASGPVQKCSHNRRVVFIESVAFEVILIPCRADLTDDDIRVLYWSREEYGEIKANQQRLVQAVIKQIEQRSLVEIEGESRRGLGLVCEPSNPKSRVNSRLIAVKTVLRAQKYKYSDDERAKLLIEDTSTW